MAEVVEFDVEVEVIEVEMVAIEVAMVEMVVEVMEVEVTNLTLLALPDQIRLGALPNSVEPEVFEW